MIATDIDLESLLEDSEEIECQSGHTKVLLCTIEITYRVTGCDVSILTCRNAVEDPEQGVYARMRRGRCKRCHRPASDCWKVYPV